MMLQRATRAISALILCVSFVPMAAHAAGSNASIDDLNARMRDVAHNATKEKSLNEMLGPHMPAVPLHSEFVVETNNKGQVARVRSGKNSKDRTFDLMTYGNALQSFIRTQSGHADAGTFRIMYDYSPKTHDVKRGIEVISLGGVNPNAEGAVYEMAREQAASQHKAHPAPAANK